MKPKFSFKKNTKFWIFSIILLGSFLRLYGLGDESFWIDEGATAYASMLSPSEIIGNIYRETVLIPAYFKKGGGEMPGYYVMTHYWTKIFGLSEARLRFFSVIFGIASIYLIFSVGKLIFSEKIGLIAAFILAINHQHIYYSQEARNYSFLVFLTLLSSYYLLNALYNNKTRYWIKYSLTCIALIYVHYLSFLIIMSHFIFMLLQLEKYKSKLKNAIVSWSVVAVSYLPWIPVLLQQLLYSSYDYSHLYRPNLLNFGTVLVQINSWISPDTPTRDALRNMDPSSVPIQGWMLISCVLLTAIFIALMFLFGSIKKYGRFSLKIFDANCIFLLLWFIVPILIPYLASVAFPSMSLVGFVSYIMFATPPYYILAARGIDRLRRYKWHSIVILAVLSIFPLYSYHANFDKDQWKEAAHLIKNDGSSETVIISAAAGALPFTYYYGESGNIIASNNLNEMKADLSEIDSLWLVYSSEKFSDPTHTIKAYLDTRYELDKQSRTTGVKIYHYKKK